MRASGFSMQLAGPIDDTLAHAPGLIDIAREQKEHAGASRSLLFYSPHRERRSPTKAMAKPGENSNYIEGKGQRASLAPLSTAADPRKKTRAEKRTRTHHCHHRGSFTGVFRPGRRLRQSRRNGKRTRSRDLR